MLGNVANPSEDHPNIYSIINVNTSNAASILNSLIGVFSSFERFFGIFRDFSGFFGIFRALGNAPITSEDLSTTNLIINGNILNAASILNDFFVIFRDFFVIFIPFIECIPPDG